MSKAKTETKMDSFQSWAHRWGRVGTLIALIYMVALPFVVLAAYDSIPSLGEVFNVNTFSILLIYIPVGFSEALSYTPILGCSAYLAFITGNIMNLKLPVAANAMNLTKKQPNTPEGEAIASVAVAVSSLMTVAILTLAAVCASFISRYSSCPPSRQPPATCCRPCSAPWRWACSPARPVAARWSRVASRGCFRC
mgnify:CR=1 FL=1